MRILKSIMVAALAVFATISVTAQIDSQPGVERVERAKKTPEQKAEKQTERLTKRLDLTEAQAAQVNAINLEYAAKGKADRDARKAENEEHSAKIRALLNEEQAAKYDKGLDKAKKKRKNKRGKKGAKRKAKKSDTEDLKPDEE